MRDRQELSYHLVAIGNFESAPLVSSCQSRRSWLNIRLDYLKVGSAKIKLRGSKGKEGESGTTSAIVFTVLFGPIGLIKHGHNVDIKKGSAIKVYVGDDISLDPAV